MLISIPSFFRSLYWDAKQLSWLGFDRVAVSLPIRSLFPLHVPMLIKLRVIHCQPLPSSDRDPPLFPVWRLSRWMYPVSTKMFHRGREKIRMPIDSWSPIQARHDCQFGIHAHRKQERTFGPVQVIDSDLLALGDCRNPNDCDPYACSGPDVPGPATVTAPALKGEERIRYCVRYFSLLFAHL